MRSDEYSPSRKLVLKLTACLVESNYRGLSIETVTNADRRPVLQFITASITVSLALRALLLAIVLESLLVCSLHLS